MALENEISKIIEAAVISKSQSIPIRQLTKIVKTIVDKRPDNIRRVIYASRVDKDLLTEFNITAHWKGFINEDYLVFLKKSLRKNLGISLSRPIKVLIKRYKSVI